MENISDMNKSFSFASEYIRKAYEHDKILTNKIADVSKHYNLLIGKKINNNVFRIKLRETIWSIKQLVSMFTNLSYPPELISVRDKKIIFYNENIKLIELINTSFKLKQYIELHDLVEKLKNLNEQVSSDIRDIMQTYSMLADSEF